MTTLPAPVVDFISVPGGQQRIVFRTDNRVLFVRPADIRWIGAEGVYARVYATTWNLLVRESMKSLEERLRVLEFFRVHRSAIVNVAHVREICRNGRHCVALLADGTQIPISDDYRRPFESFMLKDSIACG